MQKIQRHQQATQRVATDHLHKDQTHPYLELGYYCIGANVHHDVLQHRFGGRLTRGRSPVSDIVPYSPVFLLN
jgi:hypothetical protein